MRPEISGSVVSVTSGSLSAMNWASPNKALEPTARQQGRSLCSLARYAAAQRGRSVSKQPHCLSTEGIFNETSRILETPLCQYQ